MGDYMSIDSFFQEKQIVHPYIQGCFTKFINRHTELYSNVISREMLLERLNENLSGIVFKTPDKISVNLKTCFYEGFDKGTLTFCFDEKQLNDPDFARMFEKEIYLGLTTAAYTYKKHDVHHGERLFFGTYEKMVDGSNIIVSGHDAYKDLMLEHISSNIMSVSYEERSVQAKEMQRLATFVGNSSIVESAWFSDEEKFKGLFDAFSDKRAYAQFSDRLRELNQNADTESFEAFYDSFDVNKANNQIKAQAPFWTERRYRVFLKDPMKEDEFVIRLHKAFEHEADLHPEYREAIFRGENENLVRLVASEYLFDLQWNFEKEEVSEDLKKEETPFEDELEREREETPSQPIVEEEESLEDAEIEEILDDQDEIPLEDSLEEDKEAAEKEAREKRAAFSKKRNEQYAAGNAESDKRHWDEQARQDALRLLDEERKRVQDSYTSGFYVPEYALPVYIAPNYEQMVYPLPEFSNFKYEEYKVDVAKYEAAREEIRSSTQGSSWDAITSYYAHRDTNPYSVENLRQRIEEDQRRLSEEERQQRYKESQSKLDQEYYKRLHESENYERKNVNGHIEREQEGQLETKTDSSGSSMQGSTESPKSEGSEFDKSSDYKRPEHCGSWSSESGEHKQPEQSSSASSQGGGYKSPKYRENESHEGGENRAPEQSGSESSPSGGNRALQHSGNESFSSGGHRLFEHGGSETSPSDGNRPAEQAGSETTPSGGNKSPEYGGSESTSSDGTRPPERGGSKSTPNGGTKPPEWAGSESTPSGGTKSPERGGSGAMPGGGNRPPEWGGRRATPGGGNRPPEWGGRGATPGGGTKSLKRAGSGPSGGDSRKSPVCLKCGQNPCVCSKENHKGPKKESVCPVCGQSPCVCHKKEKKTLKNSPVCLVCGKSPCICSKGNKEGWKGSTEKKGDWKGSTDSRSVKDFFKSHESRTLRAKEHFHKLSEKTKSAYNRARFIANKTGYTKFVSQIDRYSSQYLRSELRGSDDLSDSVRAIENINRKQRDIRNIVGIAGVPFVGSLRQQSSLDMFIKADIGEDLKELKKAFKGTKNYRKLKTDLKNKSKEEFLEIIKDQKSRKKFLEGNNVFDFSDKKLSKEKKELKKLEKRGKFRFSDEKLLKLEEEFGKLSAGEMDKKFGALLSKKKKGGLTQAEEMEVLVLKKKRLERFRNGTSVANLDKEIKKLKRKGGRNLKKLTPEEKLKLRILLKEKAVVKVERMSQLKAGLSSVWSLFRDAASKSDDAGIGGLFSIIDFGTDFYTRKTIKYVLKYAKWSVSWKLKTVKKAGTVAGRAYLNNTKKGQALKEALEHSKERRILKAEKKFKKSEARIKSLSKIRERFNGSKVGKVVKRIRHPFGGRVSGTVKKTINIVTKPFQLLSKGINFLRGLLTKLLLILGGFLVLLILIVFLTDILGAVFSFILGDNTADGKINLTPYVEVLEVKSEEFSEKIKQKKEAAERKHEGDPVYYNISTADNTKEILSMMAVRFENDLYDYHTINEVANGECDNFQVIDHSKKCKGHQDNVLAYIKKLYDISHKITIVESKPYDCGETENCHHRKERQVPYEVEYEETEYRYLKDENGERIRDENGYYVVETYTVTKTKTEYRTEYYCPADHVITYINTEVLRFDTIFYADAGGSGAITAEEGESLGIFSITGYCNCTICCGQWSGGPTYSGVMPQANRTIAVDPDVIPLGSVVVINGQAYVAEDTGSAINGNDIDIYFDSHEAALIWGRKSLEVFAGKEISSKNDGYSEWEGWTDDNQEWAKNIYSLPDEDWKTLYKGFKTISLNFNGLSSGSGSGSGGGMSYDIPPEAMQDEKFAAMIAEAEKYLGFPYVFGGSNPSTSFDCSGFVCWVINHSGVGNVGRTTAEGLLSYCNYVSKEDAKPGDLIFFQNTYKAGVSHIGIYVGNGMMIHCGDPIQYVSIEKSYWQEHFYGFGRLK